MMRYLISLLLLVLAACNMTTENPPTDVVIATEPQTSTSAPQGFVSYWMGSDQAINDDSVLVGCQTYVSPIASTIPLSTPEENIRNSLELMFTTESVEGQRNVWGDDLDLAVNSLTIENGLATIQIAGMMMLRGTCADAEMEAQLLLAVFAEPSVESALIMLNETNMRQSFDMSGNAPIDFHYTRENIPYAS
jgi:hypothetical protein